MEGWQIEISPPIGWDQHFLGGTWLFWKQLSLQRWREKVWHYVHKTDAESKNHHMHVYVGVHVCVCVCGRECQSWEAKPIMWLKHCVDVICLYFSIVRPSPRRWQEDCVGLQHNKHHPCLKDNPRQSHNLSIYTVVHSLFLKQKSISVLKIKH